MPIVLDGSQGISTPTYGGADTSEYLVPVTQFKSRIINGGMTIDQRNAGASVTPTDGSYALDRYLFRVSQASKLTCQQNAGSVTPPVGFTNYLGVTVGASANVTVGTNDFFAIEQRIEGYNVADCNFGTANAKTVTLSFWVRSSLTGTFGGAFANGAFNRSYPFTYSISAANTWEYKTVTVAGDTSGTWATDSSTGFKVQFGFGVGSNFSGTAGSWQNITAWSATGATKLIETNGATFYITGVQLEVGSTATSFDYRPYGTELALCQRYYEKSYNTDTAVGTATDVGIVSSFGLYGSNTTSTIECGAQFRVTKRATPSGVIYDNAGNLNACNRINVSVLDNSNQAVTLVNIGMNGVRVSSSGSANAGRIAFHYTSSAEL